MRNIFETFLRKGLGTAHAANDHQNDLVSGLRVAFGGVEGSCLWEEHARREKAHSLQEGALGSVDDGIGSTAAGTFGTEGSGEDQFACAISSSSSRFRAAQSCAVRVRGPAVSDACFLAE